MYRERREDLHYSLQKGAGGRGGGDVHSCELDGVAYQSLHNSWPHARDTNKGKEDDKGTPLSLTTGFNAVQRKSLSSEQEVYYESHCFLCSNFFFCFLQATVISNLSNLSNLSDCKVTLC